MTEPANTIFDPTPDIEASSADQLSGGVDEQMGGIRPIPRISIQAFCDSESFIKTMEDGAKDRRMAKTHLRVHGGGIAAATEFYSQAPTPNLLILESQERPEQLLPKLDALSGHCDAGTKVVVVGKINDVSFYRELMARGVSEYMVGPVSLAQLLNEISNIFVDPNAEPLGRFIAFIGARGGVGSSTIAHNTSWHMSTKNEDDVVLADLDIAFGTANIDFDRDPAQTIADAIFSPDRLDETFVDRILSKCSEHLSLLTAPATLERTCDFGPNTFDSLMDLLQVGVPQIALDLPHVWTAWTQQVLARADEIVITATPDLASLRNTQLLYKKFEMLRPNDPVPHLVLNQVGVPKRPEIAVNVFQSSLGLDDVIVIPFDPELFGTASNNGQMISEFDPKSSVNTQFDMLAAAVTGRKVSGSTSTDENKSLLAKFGLGK